MDEIFKLNSIAVCLAAFNGRKWLLEQINSILNQQNVVVTIFISVDKSTDGTEDWLDHYFRVESRVVILSHGRHFGGAAPNFFRLLSDTNFDLFDYVAFADQDDIWFSDKLYNSINSINSSLSDAYSSNVIAFWPDGRNFLIDKSQKQRKWDFLFEAAGPGCTYVIKVDLIFEIQKLLRQRSDDFLKIGLHDWFIYAFARANGYKWIIDDQPGMMYRQHSENQVGVNVGLNAIYLRARKVLSGWSFQQSAQIADLVGISNSPFVISWSKGGRVGLIKLAFQANNCRRRRRDQLFFLISCLLYSLFAFKKNE